MHESVKKVLKSFGGPEKSRTFASANEETTSEAKRKEFFEKIYIDREVVQEAVSGACFLQSASHWVEESQPS